MFDFAKNSVVRVRRASGMRLQTEFELDLQSNDANDRGVLNLCFNLIFKLGCICIQFFTQSTGGFNVLFRPTVRSVK